MLLDISSDCTDVTDGGCTESPATVVRTSPAPPDDVTAPVATPMSRYIMSVVWRAAGRPNGPNIRYELARMKTRQPLDSKSSLITISLFHCTSSSSSSSALQSGSLIPVPKKLVLADEHGSGRSGGPEPKLV